MSYHFREILCGMLFRERGHLTQDKTLQLKHTIVTVLFSLLVFKWKRYFFHTNVPVQCRLVEGDKKYNIMLQSKKEATA